MGVVKKGSEAVGKGAVGEPVAVPGQPAPPKEELGEPEIQEQVEGEGDAARVPVLRTLGVGKDEGLAVRERPTPVAVPQELYDDVGFGEAVPASRLVGVGSASVPE